MKYDYAKFYNGFALFLRPRKRLTLALRIFSKISTLLFIGAYGAFIAYAILCKFAPLTLVRVLLAPALCLFLVTVLRYVINRPRPYHERGAGIIPLVEKNTQDKSFPSRHTASAFVIALTILPYALWAGIPLLVLASLVGFVRFALGVHYPSDILAGAGLGILCALAGILL